MTTQTTCKSCRSDNQRNLRGEVGMHIPGLKNVDKLRVFIFPELLVCLACGFTEFVIPEIELRKLLGRSNT